jgi:hypothetical protein
VKALWNLQAARLDAMPNRERILAFCAAVGVLFLVMYVGLLDPAGGRLRQLRQQLAADQDAVDGSDEDLAAEERYEIAVDFLEGVDESRFETGGFERNVVMPVGADGGGILEKEKQIDRHHDHAQHKAEEAEDSGGACC